MEIKKDFFKTEFGDFPKRWTIRTIQSLIEDQSIIGHLDGNHGELYPRAEEFKNDGVPYITANDLTGSKVDFTHCKYLSYKRASIFKKGISRDGDVLFAHNATVGPTGLLKTEYDFVILSTTVTYYRCNNKKLDNIFLLYLLQSPMFIRQYRSVMAQSTRFQVPITTQRKLSVFLPESHKEQQAIASALCDIDSYIESLEKLIAKKRKVLKGVMQELLTGKRRLPMFSEEWRTRPCSEMIRHLSGNSMLIKGRLGTEPGQGKFPGYSASGQDVWLDSFEHEGKSIIISAVGSRCGKAFKADGKWSAIANTHIIWTNPKEAERDFLAYFFNDENFWVKGGSGQPFVKFNESFRKSMKVPNVEEQKAISEVIESFENEIEAIFLKLSKARLIKQGMMQELLTGRIRLV